MDTPGNADQPINTAIDADAFGSNAWLVDQMYRKFLDSPGAVSESWRDFFSDYRPVGASTPAVVQVETATPLQPAPAPAATACRSAGSGPCSRTSRNTCTGSGHTGRRGR